MRNLKRALSLAMASVMLLGMMVVGTSAASFGDVDETNDIEAIEVMNAVEVMQGDERGFRPNDPINRNEIAKVMALLLKLSPEDYAYAVTPFTDVPDWAAPYVAACYANGITNGTSATTYSGANNVTAIQAARMMLRALGYLKNPQDDGDDWVLATATQASKIGLFDGVNQTGVHNALTRNQVATMAVNALEATMVEDHSDKGLEVNTPDGTTVSQAYTADYRKVEIANEGDKNYTTAAGGAGINDEGHGYQQLCEYLYGTDLKKTGSSAGEFGRPGATWKYKGKEIVGSPKTPVAVYTAKASTSTVEKDLRGYKVGTDKDNAYKVNSDVTTTKTLDDVLALDGAINDFVVPSGDTPGSVIAGMTRGGTRVELYAEDDVINSVVVIYTYVAKVTRVDDNGDGTYEVTVNVRNRGSLTDNTIEVRDSSYSKDDIVLVTADFDDDDIKTIQKADVVTGEVTAYKADSNGTYLKLDGNQYFISAAFYNYDNNDSSHPQVDDELTIYVKDGVVYAVDEVIDATKDYLFVIDAIPGLGAAEAKVAFADGTQAKIDVTKLGDDKWGSGSFSTDTDTNGMKNKIYTYTEDGGDYSLTLADGYALGGSSGEIKNDSASVTVNTPDDYTATTKTVFVDVDGKKAYTGYENVPNVTSATLAVSCESGTLADIVFIKAGDISDGNDLIFYVKGTKHEVTKLSGGAELRTYEVYVDGVKQKLTTKDMTSSSNTSEAYALQADTVYYSKTVNSDGYLTKVKNGGNTLATNASKYNPKNLSFTIPSGDFLATGVAQEGNATAKNGTLTLQGTSGSCIYDKATGKGKTVFTYNGDTVFMVVTAKDDGSGSDSVTSGSAGDIVNYDTWRAAGDEYESIVYVLDVDDDTVSTPRATLVLVIQPNK